LVAVFGAALALGLVNGARWAHFQRDTLATISLHEREKLAEARELAGQVLRGDKEAPRGWWNNPADVRGFGNAKIVTYAVKPPAPLAALATGQTDLLPYYFQVRADTRLATLTAHEIENPHRLIVGRFDAAFVLIYLLPLAVIALGFNSLATDREQGMLAILGALPVSIARLAAVRLALRALLLAVAAIVLIAMALVLGAVDFSNEGTALELARWLGVVVAYTAFWWALVALFVARGGSAATTALALAGAWLVLVVIVPWTLNLISNRLHPLPSRTDYVLAMRDAVDAAEERRSELLARYLYDHPELAPKNTPVEQLHYSATDITSGHEIEASIRPVRTEFDRQLAAQHVLIGRWQFLSPAILAQQAFNDLAGADHARHRAFLEQVERYIEELRTFFHPRILSGEYRFDAFDAWPRYTWREPMPDRRSVSTAWLGLGLPALAAVFLATFLLGRHPVK
jgi:ABC-2 type transport system permease protein